MGSLLFGMGQEFVCIKYDTLIICSCKLARLKLNTPRSTLCAFGVKIRSVPYFFAGSDAGAILGPGNIRPWRSFSSAGYFNGATVGGLYVVRWHTEARGRRSGRRVLTNQSISEQRCHHQERSCLLHPSLVLCSAHVFTRVHFFHMLDL